MLDYKGLVSHDNDFVNLAYGVWPLRAHPPKDVHNNIHCNKDTLEYNIVNMHTFMLVKTMTIIILSFCVWPSSRSFIILITLTLDSLVKTISIWHYTKNIVNSFWRLKLVLVVFLSIYSIFNWIVIANV